MNGLFYYAIRGGLSRVASFNFLLNNNIRKPYIDYIFNQILIILLLLLLDIVKKIENALHILSVLNYNI